MTEAIDLVQRLLFAGMRLRLDAANRLFLGPTSLVRTHWRLQRDVTMYKEGLTELMNDPRVAAVFGTDTEVTDLLREQVAAFIKVGCAFAKGLVMSGMNFSMCYYLWVYKNGHTLPTLTQLYNTMDEYVKRGYPERTVLWTGVGLTEDQKALIPRFY